MKCEFTVLTESAESYNRVGTTPATYSRLPGSNLGSETLYPDEVSSCVFSQSPQQRSGIASQIKPRMLPSTELLVDYSLIPFLSQDSRLPDPRFEGTRPKYEFTALHLCQSALYYLLTIVLFDIKYELLTYE
jgi:hypothetical protein